MLNYYYTTASWFSVQMGRNETSSLNNCMSQFLKEIPLGIKSCRYPVSPISLANMNSVMETLRKVVSVKSGYRLCQPLSATDWSKQSPHSCGHRKVLMY